MSQLEAARTLYSQRSEDSKSGSSDDGAAADATKKELLRAFSIFRKELLRAIELRLEDIKKDLTMTISHASASGFDPHTVADKFGAQYWVKHEENISMEEKARLEQYEALK